MPEPAQARLVSILSYREMLAKSDLVVIANPVTKTEDTKERSVLPGIARQDSEGRRSKVEVIGVDTVFAVSAVLKGNPATERFTLRHYRETDDTPRMNGPSLVRFDPSEVSNRSSYLMFLVREPDGRFAPVGGQTDPGTQAICPIPHEPR
ncbi:hypothetical protein [Occallatibacter riparius]|uniref:Uncharacterized protein n=1 Tax=Occallatibacter riparius TaxID=1002689 RepID=A0A9J7BMF1_9BACT|nr:hypothetical protein [Occallatibacter riparius]UWZ84060.1 hypothetical protein MOP44_26320 [Occallatibacter riparius]